MDNLGTPASKANPPMPTPDPTPTSADPKPPRLAVISCAVLDEEVLLFAAGLPHIVHIEMLPQGLHNEPDRLRHDLQAAIDKVERETNADAIALVYGLCSRGTEGVVSRRCRMAIARAQDCITLLLGDKQRYADYVREHPGTYWYSPGWNRHHTPPGKDRYETLLRQYREKYGDENAEYLMETEQHWFSTYDRATFVELTVGNSDPAIEYTRQCAEWLKWRFDYQRGDPMLLKDLLWGRWDHERFVVVQPGQGFHLVADERVVEPDKLPEAMGGQLEIDCPRGQRHIQIASTTAQPPRLSDLLAREGLPLNTRCGGRGLCDGCVIELRQGRLRHAVTGQTVEAGLDATPVRGCEHVLHPDDAASIHIPSRTLLSYKPQIVSEFKLNVPHAHDPLCPVGFGAAIDVGTTTVAVMLTDLTDGRVAGRASGFNLQMHLGDNVVTRINLCSSDPSSLHRLQNAVVRETIVPLLKEAAQQAGATLDRIACLSIAGNTTMLHLLAGEDPSPMGVAPFTPAFLHHRVMRGRELGMNEMSGAAVHLLPSAAAYVGSDLTAGVVATGLLYDDGPSLLVDVGTNGEIILKRGKQLLGCATAAGPAFEGAGLTCGVRAGDGAVAHVRMDREPLRLTTQLIGGKEAGKPIGICGSAYVDLLAEGRRVGLLNGAGRFHRDLAGAAAILLPFRDLGVALHVGYGQGKTPIVVTERDIAGLLQAKAAIAAGILTLLELEGLTPQEVKTLYLAGGFGMHLDIHSAIGCGLLPGFRHEQIQLVGNTALGGAYLALMDAGLIEEITRAAEQMQIIELNLDPDFEGRYIDQLSL